MFVAILYIPAKDEGFLCAGSDWELSFDDQNLSALRGHSLPKLKETRMQYLSLS